MARKASARYFIVLPVLLAMTLVAGCGGGGDSDAGIIGWPGTLGAHGYAA